MSRNPLFHIHKLSFLGLLCATAGGLGGCASTAVKQAVTSIQASPVAYGAVMQIRSAKTSENIDACLRNPSNVSYGGACSNLSDYQEAQLAFLHSSRLVQRWFLVPAKWNIQSGSILEVSPAGSYVATRLATLKPRVGCEWTGHSLDDLTSGTGMLKGFALGMLIVPAIAVAADESIHRGGVECDGWSYKALLQDG